MKTIRKILFCLLFSVVFLTSCHKEQKNNPVSFSPINQIVKMHPVKIIIASWVESVKEMPNLKMETEQEFLEAVKNPENWIAEFETADVNQINIIMTALKKPPAEKGGGVPGGIRASSKISFENKKGQIKWTIAYISDYDKKIYLPDIIYGEETYKVFAKILNNIKYEPPPQNQKVNKPTQKPSK